jgi:hypothetical protein
MKFAFLQKQTSRREMLRDSATLAGSAFLAHFFPTTVLRASAMCYAQQASAADQAASMRAQIGGAPSKRKSSQTISTCSLALEETWWC